MPRCLRVDWPHARVACLVSGQSRVTSLGTHDVSRPFSYVSPPGGGQVETTSWGRRIRWVVDRSTKVSHRTKMKTSRFFEATRPCGDRPLASTLCGERAFVRGPRDGQGARGERVEEAVLCRVLERGEAHFCFFYGTPVRTMTGQYSYVVVDTTWRDLT